MITDKYVIRKINNDTRLAIDVLKSIQQETSEPREFASKKYLRE